MENFYLKTENKKTINPKFKDHQISVPFRMLIIGASGSGKTMSLLNLIKIMDKTFVELIICCKSKSEPLYEYLEKHLPEAVTFYEGEVPDLSQFTDGLQRLIVFDDLVLDKNLQGPIGQYFIRGRKVGFSSVYISQNYFSIPKPIRSNANMILLKKIQSARDLKLIVSEFNMSMFDDAKAFAKYYRNKVKDFQDFILIDLDKGTVRDSLIIEKKKN